MATPSTSSHDRALPTHRDLYYGGAWHAGMSGRFLDVVNPATGASLGKVVDADADDVDRAVARGAQRVPGVARRAGAGPGAGGAQGGRDSARARAGAGAARGHRRRQPAARRCSTTSRSAPTTWTTSPGSSPRSRASTIPIAAGCPQLHAARAAGRHRAHRRVQPSAAVRRRQVRRAAGRRQHADRQARRPDAAVGAAHRRTLGDVFPPGVFNVVTGGRDAGAALVAHPTVAKIGFIGSVDGGRAVMTAARARRSRR